MPAERLSEVGERLGVSAERVRQIEERALAKLRNAA
jgi:DNA-directed RNA polymerase sigma subunit (sigma70/sigma32)